MTALFSATQFPGGRREERDHKVAERLLCFDMSGSIDLNEALDDSRGQSCAGVFWVPNWFHSFDRHWGQIIERFNETYTYGGQTYPVVHWIEVDNLAPLLGLQGGTVVAVMDWKGELAPLYGRYHEMYRGRIYLCRAVVDRVLRTRDFGLYTEWIDRVATVIAHEFFHRDQFINAWGGFTDDCVGSYSNWRPFSGTPGVDTDRDGLSDGYEHAMRLTYRTDPKQSCAILRWFTGGSSAWNPLLMDNEMCALLWGEWESYLVGSLDDQDWSISGRQHY